MATGENSERLFRGNPESKLTEPIEPGFDVFDQTKQGLNLASRIGELAREGLTVHTGPSLHFNRALSDETVSLPINSLWGSDATKKYRRSSKYSTHFDDGITTTTGSSYPLLVEFGTDSYTAQVYSTSPQAPQKDEFRVAVGSQVGREGYGDVRESTALLMNTGQEESELRMFLKRGHPVRIRINKEQRDQFDHFSEECSTTFKQGDPRTISIRRTLVIADVSALLVRQSGRISRYNRLMQLGAAQIIITHEQDLINRGLHDIANHTGMRITDEQMREIMEYNPEQSVEQLFRAGGRFDQLRTIQEQIDAGRVNRYTHFTASANFRIKDGNMELEEAKSNPNFRRWNKTATEFAESNGFGLLDPQRRILDIVYRNISSLYGLVNGLLYWTNQ